MVALPLPILTFLLALVAFSMMMRVDLGNRPAQICFTAVFALICCATLFIGLRFGYGLNQLAAFQRVIPLFIGPALYLGFLALCLPVAPWRKRLPLHLAPPALAALAPLLLPGMRDLYDLMILASYLTYVFLLLRLWRRGPDAMGEAKLGLVDGLRQWLLFAAGTLAVMALFDAGIAVSFALSRPEEAMRLISIGSSLSLISMAVVIFYVLQAAPARTGALRPAASGEDAQRDALEARTRALLEETRLYLDTDLTLERLARRMHVPARQLSEAINLTAGLNIPQYVNAFRIAHAARMLTETEQSATRIAEASGFLTRSNFYREFERIHGMSPAAYRKAAKKE